MKWAKQLVDICKTAKIAYAKCSLGERKKVRGKYFNTIPFRHHQQPRIPKTNCAVAQCGEKYQPF